MSYHNRKRLHKRVMEVGKVANPKLKSISAAALDEIQTQQDALLVNLVSRYAKNGTRLNIKRKDLRKPNTGKATHGSQVSDQMLAQLSVVEELLRRVRNLERGHEFFMQKIVRKEGK